MFDIYLQIWDMTYFMFFLKPCPTQMELTASVFLMLLFVSNNFIKDNTLPIFPNTFYLFFFTFSFSDFLSYLVHLFLWSFYYYFFLQYVQTLLISSVQFFFLPVTPKPFRVFFWFKPTQIVQYSAFSLYFLFQKI